MDTPPNNLGQLEGELAQARAADAAADEKMEALQAQMARILVLAMQEKAATQQPPTPPAPPKTETPSEGKNPAPLVTEVPKPEATPVKLETKKGELTPEQKAALVRAARDKVAHLGGEVAVARHKRMQELENELYKLRIERLEKQANFTESTKKAEEEPAKTAGDVLTEQEAKLKKEREGIEKDRKARPFEYFIIDQATNPVMRSIFENGLTHTVDLRTGTYNLNGKESYHHYNEIRNYGLSNNEGFFDYNDWGFVLILEDVASAKLDSKGRPGPATYDASYKIMAPDGTIAGEHIKGYLDDALNSYKKVTEEYASVMREKFDKLHPKV